MKLTSRPAAFLRTLLAVLTIACLAAPAAKAQLKIEITSGVTNPVPIAIVPFAQAPTDNTDVADVVQHDLVGSGRFTALARERMPGRPTTAADVKFADWKAAGSDYMVVGQVTPLAGGQLAVDFNLLNTLTGQSINRQRFVGTAAALRNAAHRVSDAIYQAITGIRGAFATRIAYIAVVGQGEDQRFQLVIADADGYNQHLILESRFPLMSPAWSPDGQWIAYVSFENHLSAVYVQRVLTGERSRVSMRAGINGAPAFSPDSRKLVLTLSGDSGHPQIYILDLSTQNLTRLTDTPAINTEAVWSPDGRYIYFTSDRAGEPQIYRMAARPGSPPERITFTDEYNADPHLSPDGKLLTMVTRDDSGGYRIGLQNLATGDFRVLTHGRLDTSPSFAPNGATIMYAVRPGQGRAGTLATTSVDGLTGLSLKPTQGEVRSPAWGPFIQ
ncbi:MAG TPA: Tol-Pal system beta propeller repeat protein TolB [Steroidobacteraceae bacterium]|nr:Tol-Pal system beta propeller repeat protein TolB [Steroidobacteraceae bacterium]